MSIAIFEFVLIRRTHVFLKNENRNYQDFLRRQFLKNKFAVAEVYKILQNVNRINFLDTLFCVLLVNATSLHKVICLTKFLQLYIDNLNIFSKTIFACSSEKFSIMFAKFFEQIMFWFFYI